ncbi:MAG: hypothetical protein JEY99_16130 [Spirochaetales bacterium]|nr:hypothetical protein [Spirochaetales bacterium]
MMKKTIPSVLILLITGAIFCLSTCNNTLFSDTAKINSTETGRLTVSLSPESARTLSPDVDITITSFDISGDGPGDAVIPTERVSGTEYTAENITIGSWGITVNGLNSSDEIVMTGSVITEIVSGDNAIVVDIYPLTGNGSVDFTVTWPSGVLSTENTDIVSSLLPVSGTAVPLTFTVSDGEASCSQSVAAGYYLWDLQIEESGKLIYKMNPEAVRILAPETLTHNLDISSGINIEPAFSETIFETAPLLNWFDYPDAVSYDFQISEIENSFPGESYIANHSEFQIPNDLDLKTWYWRIRPVYAGDIPGEWSNPWNFTIESGVPLDNLVAEYLFDTGSGDDSSGNSRNGTIYGAVSCIDRFGNPDGALQLDGVDDRIEVPILYSVDQDPISLAGWVNLTSDSGGALYAEFTAVSDTRNFFSLNMSSQTMAFDQFQPSGAAAISDTNPDILPNTWIFITITKESDIVKFYLNGTLFSQKSHTETYSGGSPTIAGIGDRYGSGGWEFSTSVYNIKGKIDDFRFYDRALTAMEIGNMYTDGGWEPPLTWIKDANNPVLNLGANGTWDDFNAMPGSILKEDSVYKMWYSGYDGTLWRIGYATSPDGIYWTKYSSNFILGPGTSGSWDDNGIFEPSVIKDGESYSMWYSGHDGSDWRIGYATSIDGISWTKHPANPVINPGTGWDSNQIYYPSVIKDGTTYKMWYVGSNTNGQIGYATSADGISWTKYSGNPVLLIGPSGTWNDYQLAMPSVIVDGDYYKMMYSGSDGSNWRTGYAYSLDGISWVTGNHCLDLGTSGSWDDSGASHPVLFNDGGEYKMWFTGGDGSNWRGGYAYPEE